MSFFIQIWIYKILFIDTFVKLNTDVNILIYDHMIY